MFDVGWPELLVIAIVLIVVVGPKDLPDMLRQFGRTTAKLRAMAGDFRKQFDEALKEADMEDVRDLANQARNLNPRNAIRTHLSSFEQAGQDIKAGLDAAMKPKADTSAEPASPVAHAAEPAKTAALDKGEAAPNKTTRTKRAAGKANGAKPAASTTVAAASKANGSGARRAVPAKAAKANGASPSAPAAKAPPAKGTGTPAPLRAKVAKPVKAAPAKTKASPKSRTASAAKAKSGNAS